MKARRHWMTREQLGGFLAANRLVAAPDGAITAPRGEKVGQAFATGPASFLVIVLEEGYTRGDEDEVTAWWPGFRLAWAMATADGVEVGDILGPGEVVCDLCNDEVAIRPVPVVGTWAYCSECFARLDLPFPGRIEPYDVTGAHSNGLPAPDITGGVDVFGD